MKVLVTAFKPFNNSSNNYSIEVLRYINGVDKLIIDVNYDGCYQEIIDNYNLEEYDYIISLGEARMRDVLTLESQALNISSCSIPDNSGNFKYDEVIYKDSPDVLKTQIDLNELNNLVKISDYAGKFVCNNLYYHLLHNHQSKSLFIHVPNCHDDTAEYIKNAKTITKIINVLYSHKKNIEGEM